MDQEVVSSTAVACMPAAIPEHERAGHFARARHLFTKVVLDRLDLANGYAFGFSSMHMPALVAFVANERKCCPFMNFEITASADADDVWLRLTGPHGAKEVLEAELNIGSATPSASCSTPPAPATAGKVNKVEVASRACDAPANSGRLVRWTTASGIVAALGVCAACCLLPFALISVGVAAAWAGTLKALVPFNWLFLGSAVALLGYGFYAAYWKSRPACAAGPACSDCRPGRGVRFGLWVGALLVAGGITFQYVEPLLVRS